MLLHHLCTACQLLHGRLCLLRDWAGTGSRLLAAGLCSSSWRLLVTGLGHVSGLRCAGCWAGKVLLCLSCLAALSCWLLHAGLGMG